MQFLGDNALSVLNPVMAACKAMADAGHGVEGSTIMTTMARNGTDLGIRVSGLGDRWFTGPSQVPDGLYFPGFTSADANRDIGDSTITETAGIGAFAMAAAPAIVTFVSGTPQDAINATLEMYEITVAEHPHFTIPGAGLPRHADRRRHPQGGRAGHHAAHQHRHRPPRGRRRPGRRRAGAAAGGGVREGVDGVR